MVDYKTFCYFMLTPMISEVKLKKDIVHFCQRLTQQGFVANHDGNISVKVGYKIWATPTAQNKGDVTEDMLVSLDLNGKKLSGTYSVFSKIDLHLACYRLRSDIEVVIHAHPPIATAFAVSGVSLQKVFIAEAVVTLGEEIPLVPFIPPGCPDTEKTLSSFLPCADVFLLKNHGVLAVGKDLAQAYYRLELVEHLAKIEWHAKSLGAPQPLPQKTIEKLLEKRKKAGLARPSKPEEMSASSSLDQIVAEEVNRFLSQNR